MVALRDCRKIGLEGNFMQVLMGTSLLRLRNPAAKDLALEPE